MSNNNCIGPTNIIPNNNQVVLLDNNKSITVIDNNCCTNVDVTQPITSVVQVLTGPIGPTGKFPTSGSIGLTGSFGISGSLIVTGSITANTIYSPYFTGSFYGNGNGTFSGSFSGSFSANLQDITNNGNVTTLPITASSYYGNSLQIVGNAVVTGSLTVSGSNTFRNIGPAQFTGSTDISGSLSVNGVDYEFTSASFDNRILNNSSSIALLSSSFLSTSSSLSTRVTDLENFSSSLDATFATDAELNAATASLSSSIALLSSSYEQFIVSYNTGSFSGSFTGSFYGTASWSENSITASYAQNAQTSSYVLNAISSSYAQTASYVNPLIQDVEITGSLVVTDKIKSTGSLILQPNINDIRYLEIYNSSAQDTHITASGGWLFLGDDTTYIKVDNYSTNKLIEIKAGNNLIISSSTVQLTGSLDAPNITGSLFGTASWANNAVSSSYASTASYLNTLDQNIIVNGNITINGTASIEYLNVTYESASIIYSSGSNQLGDATNDIQTLVGTVKISGSLEVTGSTNIPSLTGSLQGTASYAINAATASNILGGKATHIPFFITDTTLATSSIYQSGSTSIIINQDSNTTANPEALYVWQPSTSSFNVISGKGNLNNYLQLNIQNTNQGINASSDIVATADNGNENTNYIDMGINSENYAGFLGGPNDAYLYAHSNNLWIGNVNDGYRVYFFNSSSEQPIITLNSDNAEITGSLHGTASWAQNSINANSATSASYALTASYASNVPVTASYAISSSYAISASYALDSTNAVNSNTAISASHALNADNAANATYAAIAGNGGVTQIIAGAGITLLPPSGQGAVTVISSGGGGVTIISGSLITGSFVNATSYTFNHNLGVKTPIITVFDSNYNQIIPQNIQLVDTSSAIITFPTQESGFAIGSTGGTTGTALSSSYALFSTYANTASYYIETDPVFVAKSSSLATTGSNIFKGNQTITGSVYINSGSSLNFNGNTLYASSSTLFTNANIVPAQHNTQSLGTTTTRWKDIWLGGGSLYIADSVITGSDLVIEAINDILVVSGSAGLEVGSFKFVNNELFLKNEAIPIIIGSGSATAPVQFNRPLQIISGDTGLVTFDASREGRVAIVSPNIPAGDIGAFSIIGNVSGSYQPVTNAGGLIHITSNDNQAARFTSDAYGSGSASSTVVYAGRRARGTATNPLPIQAGDTLTRISSIGWTGPEYGFNMSASLTLAPTAIEAVALENYTTSSFGSRYNIYNVPSGSTIRTLSAQIDTTGITIPSSSRLFGTASWALNAQTASYITTAQTASYVLQAVSASFSSTSSYINALKQDVIITGSLKVSGSLTEIGNTVLSGSLTLSSGSAFNLNDGFYVNGHKQFQYASFYHTASQTLTSATTPLPFQFSTIENNSGAFTVELSGSRRSRITTNTTGWWNIQYSAQVTNGSSFNNYDSYTWIRVKEVNAANSNNIRTIPQDAFDLLASRNTLIYLESGSYFEIMYGAANTQVSFPYTGTATSPTRPATPSISLVVTQHA